MKYIFTFIATWSISILPLIGQDSNTIQLCNRTCTSDFLSLSTGYDDNNNQLIPVSSSDSNWEIISLTNINIPVPYNPIVLNSNTNSVPWPQNTSTSQWISTNTVAGYPELAPPGTVAVFERCFCYCGLGIINPQIEAIISADNIVDLYLFDGTTEHFLQQIEGWNETAVSIDVSTYLELGNEYCIRAKVTNYQSIGAGNFFGLKIDGGISNGRFSESECCHNPPDTQSEIACCPNKENLVINGHFELGYYGFTSEYNPNPSATTDGINPAEYYIGNGEDASMINNSWIWPYDEISCDYTQGVCLMIDGIINLPTNPNAGAIIWEQTIPVDDWNGYKFCMKAKALNFNHPIDPIIDVVFSMPVGNITETLTADTDNCAWVDISKNIDLWGYGNSLNVKIKLRHPDILSGNDIAIDNISLIKLDRCPTNSADFNITTTSHQTNSNLYHVQANASIVEPCNSVWWEVCEYDLVSQDCIQSTKINGVWWSPTTDFDGYLGSSSLSGSNQGVFERGKMYKITRGTWGGCNSWASTSNYIAKFSKRKKAKIYNEKEFIKARKKLIKRLNSNKE